MYVCMSACMYVCMHRLCFVGVGELWAPLRSGVLAVEWVLELDDMAVPLAQKILLFGVKLHQLGQRGKLLATIEVVVVTGVLDLYVGHLIAPPKQGKSTLNKSLSVFFFLSNTQLHTHISHRI